MYETKRENEKDLETLNTVIEDAGRKGIIMYCAGEDQGQNESNSKQPYPASSDSKRIKRIGSTDQYGNPSKFVNTNFVDYLFPGEIPVRASDITVAEDQVGSSAATALAAGLAAMILWCTEAHRVIEKKEKSTNELDFQKEGRMNVLFDALKTSNNFVNITNEINDAKDQEDCVGYLVQSCRRKVPAMIK